jgi:hypothetical protein
MTFYHFTTLARFRMNEAGEFEWSADLLPTPSNDLVHLLGPDFAEDWLVWLTTEPGRPLKYAAAYTKTAAEIVSAKLDLPSADSCCADMSITDRMSTILSARVSIAEQTVDY